MITGVYLIKNLINGNKYVGSSSCSIKRRWNSHKRCLLNNIHHNKKLQNSFNKYGIDNFCFSVLEYCLPDNCLIREQHWIDKLNPEYNISKFAQSTRGIKLSKERIKSLTNGFKNWINIPENRKEFSKKIREACLYRDYSKRKGYVPFSATIEARKRHIKNYKFLSPNGSIYTAETIYGFCVKNNLDASAMNRVIKGKFLQHKGWKAYL